MYSKVGFLFGAAALVAGVRAQQSGTVIEGVATIDGTVVSNCPGVATKTALAGSTSDVYCCIEKDPSTVTASECPGFPFCSDSSDQGLSINSASCEAYIPATASNYDELVASATQSVAGVQATGDATSAAPGSSAAGASQTSQPTATSTPGTSTTDGTGGSDGSSSSSSSSSGSGSSSASGTSGGSSPSTTSSSENAAGRLASPATWMCLALCAAAGVGAFAF